MSYANNNVRSLISAFIVRCLDSVMSLVSVTKISSLLLASVAEHASLKSKKISNDQELIKSDPTSCPQNQKGNNQTQTDGSPRKAPTSNRMNSSFQNRWSLSYLKFTKYVINIIAEPKYKYGQQEQVTERNHNRSTPWNRQ